MEETQYSGGEHPSDTCAHCGSPAVLSGYPTKLCAACRETFIKYPFPKWLLLFAGGIAIIVVFSLATLPRNISAGISLEKGKKAAAHHRYATAQKEFEKVAKIIPGYTEGQGQLMVASFYNLDFNSFFKAYQAVENKNIEDKSLYAALEDLSEKAKNYFATDSFLAISNHYDSLQIPVPDAELLNYMRSHSGNIYPAMLYASALAYRDDYKTCDSIGQVILHHDSAFVPALRLMTTVERELGHYPQSLDYCDRLLLINREDVYAAASKARTCLKCNRDREALQLAIGAHDIDNKDGYALATLALAYHYTRQPSKRDQIIRDGKKDSLNNTYMSFAVDIIEGRKKFRD